MRVALFGGSGFIGGAVASLLDEGRVEVLQISRTARGPNGFAADIAVSGSLDKLSGPFDAAIICSALLPKETYDDTDAVRYLLTNAQGPLNVAAWCRRQRVGRVVFCSTLSMLPVGEAGARGELVDTSSHYRYKISKAAGEHLLASYCREHGLVCTCLRLASVYGPGMPPGIIQLIIDKIGRGEKFVLQGRYLTADFIHVRDVASVIVSCLPPNKPEGIVNVNSGTPVAIYDLAKQLCKLMDDQYLEIEVLNDKLNAAPLHNNNEALSLLGRPFITFETGLKEILSTR